MDITIDCKELSAAPVGHGSQIRVELEDIDVEDLGQVMTDLGVDEVVRIFDNTAVLLDAIGEDAVREHFGIADEDGGGQ